MPAHDEQTEALTFEAAMESLDAIVAALEGQRLPLEDMVTSYERGMKLLRVCRSRIESARQRVEIITADLEGRGKASLSEFTAPDTAETTSGDAPKRQPRKKSATPEPPPPDTGETPGDIRLL